MRVHRVGGILPGASPDAGDSALEDSALPGRYLILEFYFLSLKSPAQEILGRPQGLHWTPLG